MNCKIMLNSEPDVFSFCLSKAAKVSNEVQGRYGLIRGDIESELVLRLALLLLNAKNRSATDLCQAVDRAMNAKWSLESLGYQVSEDFLLRLEESYCCGRVCHG